VLQRPIAAADSETRFGTSAFGVMRRPRLIMVATGWWVAHLSAVRATCSALHDGLRYRYVQVHVGGSLESQVLSHDNAGERGAPYRDLTLRPKI